MFKFDSGLLPARRQIVSLISPRQGMARMAWHGMVLLGQVWRRLHGLIVTVCGSQLINTPFWPVFQIWQHILEGPSKAMCTIGGKSNIFEK